MDRFPRKHFLGLLLILFAVTAESSAALAQVTSEGEGSKEPPPYKLLRYDEDYSYLKDPSRRSDLWDVIKYIPFAGREDWYLSVGGEARLRYELYHNEDF